MRVRSGVIEEVEHIAPDLIRATVKTSDGALSALAYPALVGNLRKGDPVLVNTTAAYLALGTGSYNFIINVLEPTSSDLEGKGHIIKLRYTPLQLKCLALEEEDNPLRPSLDESSGLEGIPVIAAPLHSHIMSIAPAIKSFKKEARVVYIMTDSAALPMAVSENVRILKEKGLIDVTISCGQAFGGDHEAVNVYSALLAAKSVFRADVIIVSPGPGKVGTETRFGFSEIEQGEVLNAIGILGGVGIAVLRINVSDRQYRHFGISHHSMTVLTQICLKRVIVPVPLDERDLACELRLDIDRLTAHPGVTVAHYDASDPQYLLRSFGLTPSTMGKSHEEEPVFFACGVAAARCAVERIKDGVPSNTSEA